jgi:hypothetical protein
LDKIKIKLLCTVSLAVLAIGAIFFSIVLTLEYNAAKRFLIKSHTRINSAVVNGQAVSEGERALTWKAWYVRVIMTHSSMKRDRRMTDWQITRFVHLAYHFENLFDFPRCYLLSKALMESAFNPRTDGRFTEVGIFQHHSTTIEHIKYCFYLLKKYEPAKAREVVFDLHKQEQLYDPIKSLKAQAALAWKAKRDFSHELYWISASHWGGHRVRPWYVDRRAPREEWIFYSEGNLQKIDRRHPLLYYYRWKAINDKLASFDLKVYKQARTYRSWVKSCKRTEAEYIKARRHIANILSELEKYKRIEKKYNAQVEYIQKIVKNAETKRAEIYRDATVEKTGYEKLYAGFKKVYVKTITELKGLAQ